MAAAASAAESGTPTKSPELPYHEAAAAAMAAVAASVGEPVAHAKEAAKGVNFRDLHTVSALIQPGRVYRSSQIVSAHELEGLGVRAVLDLRQPPVACKTERRNLRATIRQASCKCWSWLAGLVGGGRYARGLHSGGRGSPDAALQQEPCWRCTQDTCEHYGVTARVYHVDLLPTHVSLRILWQLPRRLQARVLWAAARRQHPEPIVAGAVADPQVMGYLKLYVLLLERAKPRLAAAMRLCAHRGNLPLLVHCIHGKDRTGLVAMLLLLLCGAEREAVVRDYALSEVLLRESREKRELLGLAEHLTTDQIIAAASQVMEQTIAHLEERYGSARNYLKALGLTDAELEAIVRNLTQPAQAAPGTAAKPAPA
ncbi:hypothetical protein ABPG77_008052 [Micractinium sp. CCAP 211/92]